MPERRQTIRQALVKQQDNPQAAQIAAVEKEITDARNYFGAIIPAHMNANQFTAMVIAMLRKDNDLALAAMRNPQSLMGALAHCASLGLTPGDGYALTHFNNRETGIPDMVGMVEYTGELTLMYNTGQVRSVTCEIVYAKDTFDHSDLSGPPVFLPAGGYFATCGRPAHSVPGRAADLGADTQRGVPVGAFCFVTFKDGGVSATITMSEQEIMTHRAKARTKKVWDSDNWPPMWRKTLVHEMRKWVPRSAEYVAELMRANAALVTVPQPAPAAPAGEVAANGHAQIEAPAAMDHSAAAEPGPATGQPRTKAEARRAAAARTDEPAPVEVVSRMGQMLAECGIDDGPEQVRTVRALAGRWDISAEEIDGPLAITRGEADTVMGYLRDAIDQSGGDPAAALAILAPLVKIADDARWETGGSDTPAGPTGDSG